MFGSQVLACQIEFRRLDSATNNCNPLLMYCKMFFFHSENYHYLNITNAYKCIAVGKIAFREQVHFYTATHITYVLI